MITIGPYTLTLLANSNYWIRHESGEGGEFAKEKLEAWLAEFYRKEF